MTDTSIDRITTTVERELARLRSARPHLASRIDRAEHILTAHLSMPRANTIKVRVGGGGRRYLVKGSAGAVYVVNPATWDCGCPDAHRRGRGCKHAVACYVLDRAVGCGRRRKTARPKTIRHDGDSLRGITGNLDALDAMAARMGV